MKIIRFKTIFFVIIACFLISIVRAFCIELLSAKRYKQIYTNDVDPTVQVQGKRGLIFDSKGKILATNLFLYDLFIDPKYYLKNQKKIDNTKFLNFVDKVFNINIQDIIQENPKKQYINIGILPIKYYHYVKINIPLGFGLQKLQERYYPYENTVSHIIGFVDENGNGVIGVEKQYNMYLEGQKIFEKVYLTPYGNLNYTKIPQNGDNIHLTINETVQSYLHYLLKSTLKKHKAKMAMGIVMKPDGAILAMDDVPGYNDNKYYDYTNYSRIKDMPINFLFEPGSVFKIVTMSSALNSGIFNGHETLWCDNGYWPVFGHVIEDVEDNKHLRFDQVFAYSSNVCSAKIALKENKKIFYKYLWRFGFGKKTGIDLPGEESGIVKDYVNLRPFDLATMAFGQGISVTQIQLARAYCAIANGGYLITPHVLNYISKNHKIIYKYKEHFVKILKPQTVKKVKHILADVVKYGTGIYAQLKNYSIGGKTGTAQVANGHGGYSKKKYIGSFVAIFPLNKPRFVILITVVDPKGVNYGGVVAAPYVAKMASFLAAYYKIPGNNTINNNIKKIAWGQ
ncbi:peptidoglycan D,D-transpeptidase FtsI family protein [Desulfurella sp.]|uniref:peptidoglycan D,D-transpeptidase FtsI family protein n=4 Tax=Desulfurella sp. TaxID=1962857 RepID=UPI00257E3A05|nr:penicillin-binding protein 2 [Desulfurella sp.]